jgi:RNA polymerase sigma-70 factor (ECF subfamily)
VNTWDDLFELLGPIHDDVQLFARRIARSAAEGDDVFQEAVLRAVNKLGSLRDRARFKPWMYSVVVSVHRSRRRSPFWTRWISSEPPEMLEGLVGDDGATWVDDQASAQRATAALSTLEPAQREAIVLFELHGYSIEEIAEIQRASVAAFKSRLTRGRDRLRAFYAKLGQPSPINALTEEVCRG